MQATSAIMNVEEARRIKDLITEQTFDSHDFIKIMLKHNAALYGEILTRYNDVTTADREIGKFLQNYSDDLDICKINTRESPNILSNINSCALWRKK